MAENYNKVIENLVVIAGELYRFKGIFAKAISKLEIDEQTKYASQYAWFEKKVKKALAEAGLRLVNLEGQLYDPGMAVTPLNIDEFEPNDKLFIEQIIEPIIMSDNAVYKTGTVILGRVKQ